MNKDMRNAGSVVASESSLSEFEAARDLLFAKPASDHAIWLWRSPVTADLDSLIAVAMHIDGPSALLTVATTEMGVRFHVRGQPYLVPWSALDPSALARVHEVLQYQGAAATARLKAAADLMSQAPSADPASVNSQTIH